jgi:hypothetical protein
MHAMHSEAPQWLTLLCLLLQHGTVDDVLAVYGHQQQLYGFASLGVQTTLIHALLKAHGRGQPGSLLAYEAWGRMKASGRQLDAQALLAGAAQRLGDACSCMQWRVLLRLRAWMRCAAFVHSMHADIAAAGALGTSAGANAWLDL